MTSEFAKQFAYEWVAAWNLKDLSAIMAHYAAELDFTSPVIKQIGFNEQGKITTKEELQAYFSKALELYPDLHFELHEICAGVDSLVLYYTSVHGKRSAEFMQFNSDRKVCRVMAHYGLLS